MDKNYIQYNGEICEILNTYKKTIGKAIFWVYVTEIGEFSRKDDIWFVYKCYDCGEFCKPFKSPKPLKKDYTKRLCRVCLSKGERNPFYGKTFTEETLDKKKISGSKASKLKWEDPEYRAKVIAGVSKPRREGFKQEQSERVSKWYKENPNQRKLRSGHMRKTWKDGKIIPCVVKVNKSKSEKKLFEYIKSNFPNDKVEDRFTIRGEDKHYFFPDIIINDKIIVEYYGSYWHGNPMKYRDGDLVAKDVPILDVWERDKKRVDTLIKMGYDVIIVWQDEDWESSNVIGKIKGLL